MQNFSFIKLHLKLLFAKWSWQFWPGRDEFTQWAFLTYANIGELDRNCVSWWLVAFASLLKPMLEYCQLDYWEFQLNVYSKEPSAKYLPFRPSQCVDKILRYPSERKVLYNQENYRGDLGMCEVYYGWLMDISYLAYVSSINHCGFSYWMLRLCKLAFISVAYPLQ